MNVRSLLMSVLAPRKIFYFALTALTFWLISYDVLFRVPSLGPIPQPVVKASVFAAFHVGIHMVLHAMKH